MIHNLLVSCQTDISGFKMASHHVFVPKVTSRTSKITFWNTKRGTLVVKRYFSSVKNDSSGVKKVYLSIFKMTMSLKIDFLNFEAVTPKSHQF